MIVTRQRKKKQSSLPVLLPMAAIIMLIVAVTWPPSRNFITNGPLKPVATVFDGIWSVVSRPLTFAFQQEQITEKNRELVDLNAKVAADAKAAGDKDAQIAQLQKQIQADQAQPAEATPAPAVPAGAPLGTQPGAAAGTGTASQASDAIRRTAQQWSSMDPEAAAALVQKLPTGYVSAVFAQMSPDSVGPIMDALPPKVAALIVQSGTDAQISAPPGR